MTNNTSLHKAFVEADVYGVDTDEHGVTTIFLDSGSYYYKQIDDTIYAYTDYHSAVHDDAQFAQLSAASVAEIMSLAYGD